MKSPIRSLFLFLALLAATLGVGCEKAGGPAGAAAAGGGAYQCPMHPWVRAAAGADCTVCGMKLVAAAAGSPAAAGPALVMLPRGGVTAVGLTTVPAARRPLRRTLRVGGMIGEDESRHGVISAPVEGRIDGLAMSCEGERVNRRQPLVTIYSRTLLAAAQDYQRALTNGGADLAAAQRLLLSYGLVHEQIIAIPARHPDDAYFGLLAPLSGAIVKSYVAEGQVVRAGDKLFELADFTKLWFMFTAYEQDLPWLKVGQTVRLTTPSLPGEVFTAPIAFISPNLNEMTRSTKVRVVLENPERRFHNNAYAQGVVELDAPEVLAVPRSAVLWPGGEPRVYVAVAPGSYAPRTLRLGRAGDSDYEVLAGLEPGAEVVVNGNLLLDSQAQWDQLAFPEAPSGAPTGLPGMAAEPAPKPAAQP